MLGDSSLVATSSDDQTTATRVVPEEGGQVCEGGGAGGFGSNSTEEDKNTGVDHKADRMNYGANRWPRQETLALLKTRSAMDAVFRDSSLKGPLWEDVSRKLAELGYHRSAKKCKEKFENLYKYHKRIKEGRTDKSEGKTYKFFYELEAFQNHHSHSTQTPTKLPPPLPPPKAQTPTATTATLAWTTGPAIVSHVSTVPSTTSPIDIMSQSIGTPATIHTINAMPLSSNYPNPSQNTLPSSLQNLVTHLFSSSTSSSTASDEKMEGGRKRKRKRNWQDFFLRLTRDVIKKQEDLQKRFLETVDKCEHERMASEEAWRMKDIARMNREHEALIQERSMAASKDAAFLAFLQKITGQQNSTETQAIPQPKLTPPPPQPRPRPSSLATATNLEVSKWDNGENVTTPSSSRWPKAEVQALINLRVNLHIKYREIGAKGPLWEDISAGMQKLGYNRSSKRCKEKWENINKYFKKVKESNRKRPEDSKTCPYFDQLDALYKEKNIMESAVSTGYDVKPISTMEPLMVLPEQQLPFEQANLPEKIIEDNERDINFDPNIEEDDEIYDDGGGGGDTEQEEDEGGNFEVAAHKSASLGNGE